MEEEEDEINEDEDDEELQAEDDSQSEPDTEQADVTSETLASDAQDQDEVCKSHCLPSESHNKSQKMQANFVA